MAGTAQCGAAGFSRREVGVVFSGLFLNPFANRGQVCGLACFLECSWAVLDAVVAGMPSKQCAEQGDRARWSGRYSVTGTEPVLYQCGQVACSPTCGCGGSEHC